MHLPRFVWPLLPLLLHISLALYYRWTGRVVMRGGAEGWDWLWQVLDVELLRSDLWQNLWDLHMQPPLYNLYGAFFVYLQPNDFLSGLHYANLLAGGLLSAMCFALAYTLTRSRLYASLVACAVALNPALCLCRPPALYHFHRLFVDPSGLLAGSLSARAARGQPVRFCSNAVRSPADAKRLSLAFVGTCASPCLATDTPSRRATSTVQPAIERLAFRLVRQKCYPF